MKMAETSRSVRLAVLATAASLASPIAAQTVVVNSIQANAPNLGDVVSGASGDTVFQISASSGNVTKLSGSGVRLGAGNTRALVTLRCTGGSNSECPALVTTVTINAGGTTGRARALTSFTVAPGSSPPTIGAVTSLGPGTIRFTVTGIPKNANRNFYLGANFGIGDNSAGASGAASSAFTVSVPANTLGGAAIATVFRPLSVAVNSDLVFGTIARPRTGSGTVTVTASNNNRAVTGTGTVALVSPAHSRASFTVSGEGGQDISITVPISFVMSGPGPDIVVTVNSSQIGSRTLSSSLGSQGTHLFYVGGSFPVTSTTPVGSYSGPFTVNVDYN
jgi:hypothetical protein